MTFEQRLAVSEGAAHRHLWAEQACAVRGTAGTELGGCEPGGERRERRELYQPKAASGTDRGQAAS